MGKTRLSVALLALALTLAACGPGRDNPVRRALAESPPDRGPTAVAFRLAAGRSGGDTRLYVLPTLDEATWRFRTPDLRTDVVVGFSRDQDALYLLTPNRTIAALDLQTGRARLVDTAEVTAATLGPTGRLHLVRADGAVGAVDHRNVAWWSTRLEAPPRGEGPRLWGGSGRVVAVVPGDSGPELVVLTATKAMLRRRIPQGPVAVGPWGEIAVVGTDSGLITLDLSDTTRTSFVRLRRAVKVVAVAPAGHRYYAGDAEGRLVAIDPLEGDVVNDTRLPGSPRALRLDPLGRTLLARPGAGDSVWIVDLTRFEFIATVPSEWRDDLPAVAPDGSLLTPRDGDVLALDPDSLVVTGRVNGGARDRWLLAAWDPRRPALQLAVDTATPRPADDGELHFVQVSSSANQAWADDLARNLRAAGIEASVLEPSPEEDRFRVVLGPYPTREAAEAMGRKLGLPFWIFTRTRQAPPPL
ncbi:MAG TPA: SPOR domain-containing protein [Gemmatimonadales bacterium]|nr:SPOR domain-containing protein [Gemmatimonadales bacterium]